jgi:hypothetical protein
VLRGTDASESDPVLVPLRVHYERIPIHHPLDLAWQGLQPACLHQRHHRQAQGKCTGTGRQ